MRRVSYGLALLGAAVAGAAVMAAVGPVRTVVVEVERPAGAVAEASPPARKKPRTSRPRLPAKVSGAAKVARAAKVERMRRPARLKARKAARPQAATRPKPARAKPARAKPKRRGATGRIPLRPTMSLYEHTTSPAALRRQGCRAGKARQNGLVILAFGKPAYRKGVYGTIVFSNRFASNRSITWAMKSFARGYETCLPKRAKARIVLARGTSNYDIRVPSALEAGRQWALHTDALALYLKRHGFERVTAAAAVDAEPAWDRRFLRTRRFFRGYESMHTGHLLYNFGSLDGGVGTIWSLRQAWYVAGGMKYVRAVPEIYNQAMAEQWATLSRLSVRHFGRPVPFAGLMTQHRSRCGECGFTSKEAQDALMRELARHPTTVVRRLAAATNIRWAHTMD